MTNEERRMAQRIEEVQAIVRRWAAEDADVTPKRLAYVVVETEPYEPTTILAIFDSRAMAEEFVRQSPYGEIEEHELNPGAKALLLGWSRWEVYLAPDGVLLKIFPVCHSRTAEDDGGWERSASYSPVWNATDDTGRIIYRAELFAPDTETAADEGRSLMQQSIAEGKLAAFEAAIPRVEAEFESLRKAKP